MIYTKFKKFNESFGIAESSILYSDFLLEEFSEKYKNWKKTNKDKFIEVKKYNNEYLSEIIDSPKWTEYPVSSIIVEWEIIKMSNEKFSKKYSLSSKTKDFITTGGCYNLVDHKSEDESYIDGPINDRSPKTICLRINLCMHFCDKFDDYDSMIVEFESLITHELNHAYEGWQRLKNKSPQISTDVTMAILDNNRARIKKELRNVWFNNIEYLIYATERHEISALVQEVLPYIKRYPLEEVKKRSLSWKYSDKMVNFDVDKFKEEFNNKTKELYPDGDPNFFLKYLKTALSNQLIKLREDSKLNIEDKPTIDGNKIKNMDIDEFLIYVKNRLNIAGEKIQKKILKLYYQESKK